MDFTALAFEAEINPLIEQLIPYYLAARDFLFGLFSSALAGDFMSLVFLGIIAVVFLIVVFLLAASIYGIIKRLFLLLIVVVSFYLFMENFGAKLLAQGTPLSILIVGVIGVAFGVFAVISVFFSLHSHASSREFPAKEKSEEIKIEDLKKPGLPFAPSKFSFSKILSTENFSTKNFFDAIRSERSIMSVLSYIIVAEFGVFSTVTISAPNVFAGLALFAVFLVASLFFIKTTYHSYSLGVIHLFIGLIFAVILSILLGHFWANIPLNELLSWNFFQSIPLVAVITGLALSLFMGSRS